MNGIIRRSIGIIVLFIAGSVSAADPELHQNVLTTQTDDLRVEFFKLCDIACRELPKETFHTAHKAFYREAYAVRALNVAYDMTGDARYLDICKLWSDRMIHFQLDMTPAGAYYMNYHRKPGETEKQWYVADSSCIGMGVLTTAIRCSDTGIYDKYLNSVKAFVKLVQDNYIDASGGIKNGLWEKFNGPWWCSSGVFGSLAYLLYDQTGDDSYLNLANATLDWLNDNDFRTIQPYPLSEQGPSMIMYFFETYATAWPFLENGSPRMQKSVTQFNNALDWMAQHQVGRGGNAFLPYHQQWGSKIGATPFLMFTYARHTPNTRSITAEADKELRFVLTQLYEKNEFDSNPLNQLMMFSMMSLAERLDSGALYRTSFMENPNP